MFKKNIIKLAFFITLFIFSFPTWSLCQTKSDLTESFVGPESSHLNRKRERKGELYLSWGYNTEWYTHSNVKISQPTLGNSFTFVNITGHDHKGWDEGLFTKAISIPQYNYRLGYIFNRKKGWGVEINFDHTKFIFTDNQTVHIKGQYAGKSINTNVIFADSTAGTNSSSYYYLNNGANFLLFNIVRRKNIWTNKKETLRLDGLAKFGVGPLIPHVENKFFEQPKNDPHFQIGGWNVGAELDLKITFFQYAYLEYGNKVDYARYTNLKIYQGTAKQAFGTYEMILNLGLQIPIGKMMPNN